MTGSLSKIEDSDSDKISPDTLESEVTSLSQNAPILTLPVELLACVLEQLLFVERAPSTSWHSFGSYWRHRFKDSTLLLAVSQTCRLLREVALSRPDLWGHLSEAFGQMAPLRLLPRPILDLFISRSQASPIVAVADPDRYPVDGDFLGVLTPNSQIEEIHLLHTNQFLMDSLSEILASANPAHLKVLTCAWRETYRRCTHAVTLDHRQLPVLRYLCLATVRFRLLDPPLRQPFSSITNLVLFRICPPSTPSDIQSLLRLCPSLRSVVVALSFSLYPSIQAPTDPLPTPSSLRRLILDDINTRAFGFFLSLFPPEHPIALQLLTKAPKALTSFQYKPALKQRLHGKLTHLRISVAPVRVKHPHLAPSYLLSVTFATDSTAVRVASVVDTRLSNHGSDVWLSNLLSASGDALDFSAMREVWVTKLTDALTAGGDLGPLHADVIAALRRMPLLDTVVLVTVYRPPGYGAGSVYTPDLSIVPGTTGPGDGSTSTARPNLKTLRLVYCDAYPGASATTGAHLDNQHERVSFQRMLEQLALSESQAPGGCPENLVVQLSPRFEIDDAEEAVAQLRRHFRTVVVERIDSDEMPRMPLPPCCVESDEGPGGSYTWREQF